MPSASSSSATGARQSGAAPTKATVSAAGSITLNTVNISTPMAMVASRRHASSRTVGAMRCARIAADKVQRSLEETCGKLYSMETEYLPAAAGLARMRPRAALVDGMMARYPAEFSSAALAAGGVGAGSVPTINNSGVTAPPLLSVDQLMRPRDYIAAPLRSAELHYLVNSSTSGSVAANANNATTAPSTPTAAGSAAGGFPTAGTGASAASSSTATAAASSSSSGAAPTSPSSAPPARVYHGWSVIGQEAMIEASDHATYMSTLVADPCRIVSLSFGPSMAFADDAKSRATLRGRAGVAADVNLAEQLDLLKRGQALPSLSFTAAAGGEEDTEKGKESAAAGEAAPAGSADGPHRIDAEVCYTHPMAIIRRDV